MIVGFVESWCVVYILAYFYLITSEKVSNRRKLSLVISLSNQCFSSCLLLMPIMVSHYVISSINTHEAYDDVVPVFLNVWV